MHHAAVLLVCLVLALPSSLSAHPPSESWASVAKRLADQVQEYRSLTGKADGVARRVELAASINIMIKQGLDPAKKGAARIRRLQGLLPYLDDLAPEIHYVLHDVFSSRMREAIQSIDRSEHATFVRVAKKLWSARKRSKAEKTDVQRMVLATGLADLVRKAEHRAEVIEFVHDVLEREVKWIAKRKAEPVSLEGRDQVPRHRPLFGDDFCCARCDRRDLRRRV